MQSVQCGHACLEAGRLGLIPKNIEHPHLIVCTCAHETELQEFAAALAAAQIRCAVFIEPDLGNQLTAICTEPIYGDRRRIFTHLPLLKLAHASRSARRKSAEEEVR